MKKYATILVILMIFPSTLLFGQSRKETSVKLEWQEQTFIHFYQDISGSVYLYK